MSDAGEIAALTVALHERDQHAELTANVARMLSELERACNEADALRAELAAHLATYHAPEPEPEEEREEEEPEEPEPEEAPPPEEKEPEPEPEPELMPENRHLLLRGVLSRG